MVALIKFDYDLFKELNTLVNSKVKIGNGEYISIKGKGTVAIESLISSKVIKDVLFVPNINQNLLSVRQLIEKGLKVVFKDNKCLIKDATGEKVFKIKMTAKSFALDLLQEDQAAYSKIASITDIWHKRLSHFHHATVLKLHKNELVQGLPQLESELQGYKAC